MWAVDVGTDGMLCESTVTVWPGSFLDLRFRLATRATKERPVVSVQGQVVTLRSGESGLVRLGIRFVSASAQAKRTLYGLLDDRRSLWSQAPAPLLPQPTHDHERDARIRAELGPEPFATLLLGAQQQERQRQLAVF